VVAAAVEELRVGRTPSPDIWCNQRIKFGLFLDKLDPGFDRLVSGHYAQIEYRDGVCVLKRSPDQVKDQTYFLCALDQGQLRRLWFPIGHLSKGEVRRLAREWQLPNRDRKDSQGICFLGKIKYPEFVRFHLGERTGEIVELETGRTLAEHRGFWFYTIGQRKGIGLAGGPWYVVKKDVAANRVYVSHSDHYLDHARRRFVVSQVNWIAGEPEPRQLQVKVRHGPRLADCQIRSVDGDRWEVTLAEADQGIAPGQSAVFYDGEFCVGGGVIHPFEQRPQDATGRRYLPDNRNAATLPSSRTLSSRVFRFLTFRANSPVPVRSSLTVNAELSSSARLNCLSGLVGTNE